MSSPDSGGVDRFALISADLPAFPLGEAPPDGRLRGRPLERAFELRRAAPNTAAWAGRLPGR